MCLLYLASPGGRGALGGQGLNTPTSSFTCLVVDAGCRQGPQLGLSTEIPACGLFMWLLVFVTAWCLGSNGSLTGEGTRLEGASPFLT